MRPFMRNVWILLKEVYLAYSRDKVPRLAAALAFYTAFSIAPLLVIVVSTAGLVYGEQAVKGLIVGKLSSYLGDSAEMVEAMIAGASELSSSILATIISVGILIFGASHVFVHLQEALDTVWEVPPDNMGFLKTIKSRFIAFLMILLAGFFILGSLLFSVILNTISTYFVELHVSVAWPMVDFILRFGVITLLFALIFKTLPEVKVAWMDVWLGAVITTILFALGRYLLGLYLSRGTLGSVYGAAGSLAILLYWCYYSAQILFIGAEITQVYARLYGSYKIESGALED